MKEFFKEALDWSEVWAPIIPLTVYFIKKPKSNWVKPVIAYLVIVFFLILCADIIWKRDKLHISDWIVNSIGPYFLDSENRVSNNIFYNLNSAFRFLFFAWFFHNLYRRFVKLNKLIPWIFIILAIINYLFFQSIHDFSSRQFTVEGVLLLLYCLFYFHEVNMDNKTEPPASQPHFWVVTGLTIFTAVNFFIVLFYTYLAAESKDYARFIWGVQNINNIILNLFIAFALAKSI